MTSRIEFFTVSSTLAATSVSLPAEVPIPLVGSEWLVTLWPALCGVTLSVWYRRATKRLRWINIPWSAAAGLSTGWIFGTWMGPMLPGDGMALGMFVFSLLGAQIAEAIVIDGSIPGAVVDFIKGRVLGSRGKEELPPLVEGRNGDGKEEDFEGYGPHEL